MPTPEGSEEFMRAAVALAREGMRANRGGPFGAVVVRAGEIVARASNEVLAACDPTAHAEIVAIRRAAQATRHFSLAGCQLYTSCEPCPMCLAAIYWARLDRVYYACTRGDAAAAGFDDDMLYREVALSAPERSVPCISMPPEEAWSVFAEWSAKPDKLDY